MVKSKQRQLATKHSNKKSNQGGRKDSSNPNIKLDILGEDGWVIVKKQRVTILIPPLPAATKSKVANHRPGQLEAKPRKKVQDQPRISVQMSPKLPSKAGREKPTSLAQKEGIETARRSPAQHISTLAVSPALGLRVEPENPVPRSTLKSHKLHGVPEGSKTIIRTIHCPYVPVSGNMLLNRRLRMSNLERKLQQAGGLSRWLASLGLGQFVRIFQAKSISKFQLVNLNMQKLKDMGADAVGPRRKLIHAIDCVCQSYHLDAL
ncbi:hypothetical protein PTKIN_Ptkin13bG0233900 [Pterospermum kingtungense]